MTLVLFNLYWWDNSTTSESLYKNYIRWISLTLLVLGVLSIILNRTHYTVDVLVGIYVPIGVWFVHMHFFASKLEIICKYESKGDYILLK